MDYLPRDLSWLRFNARVLQEAQCPTVPLLERLKFLAIFSSNLDEFFKVRVATLRRLVKLKKKTRAQLPQARPKRVLAAVLAEVQRQQELFGQVFRNELQPALAAAGICLLRDDELSAEQRRWVQQYFEDHVRDLLSPEVLDDTLHHLFLQDQAVYLTFYLSHPTGKGKHRAEAHRVVAMMLPTKAHGGRFVALPGGAGTAADPHCVLFLDDVVRVGAASLFPEYDDVKVNAVKLSRDAELDIEEEVSGDLLAKIRSSLAKRATGYPARLLYDPAMPREVLRALKQKTGISDEELVVGSRYHNFRDFFGFPSFGRTDLLNPAWPALRHATLPGRGLLAAVAQRDHLLHTPYQRFDTVVRLLREAARDPLVHDLSITLYRVAGQSAVAQALLLALKNGKQVTVVVELKARFDEENNTRWAEKLQAAGATVIFTPPELKCHAKLLLLGRPAAPAGRPRRLAYLSTGNFNEATAGLYADHALLTANHKLTDEVAQVFDYFRTGKAPTHLRQLLVAPFTLRKQLLRLIAAEAERARRGEEAYIILKINSLEDPGMIEALYEASRAGVHVELLIRGIGCLVPGVANQSATISQRGLIDRYLEHARIYVFANGSEEKVYLSSADLMTRNLDRRVEVAFPVLDPGLRAEVRQLLDFERHDNEKARDFDNHYLTNHEPPLRTQEAQYAYLQRLARRR